MDWFLEIAVSFVIGVLQRVIKNPKSVQVERSVIQHIADAANQALTAIDAGSTPTTPPATAA